MSREEELIKDWPEQLAPEPAGRGAPRFRHPERRQLGWHAASFDELIAPEHPVRAVWAFAKGLDLGALHAAVKAREGAPGQAPAAPELMMALWLWSYLLRSPAEKRKSWSDLLLAMRTFEQVAGGAPT